MGTIVRQVTWPIEDGDSLSGAEFEAELVTMFAVVNGNIEDANVSDTAAIGGTKLQANSVPASSLVASTITTGEIADSSLIQLYFAGADGLSGTALTPLTSFQDLPDIKPWSLTPHSASDYVFLDLTISYVVVVPNPFVSVFSGFSIAGTDTDDLHQSKSTVVDNNIRHLHAIYGAQVGTTNTISIKPRYRTSGIVNGAGRFSGSGYQVTFKGMYIPTK